MNRTLLGAVLGGLIVGAGFVAAGWLIERPTVLRVAVGPPSGDDHKVMAALSQLARDRGQSIRFKVTTVDGAAASAAALEAGEADLAVVRSDVAMPSRGRTVLIMRRLTAVLFAPAGSPLKTISDLRGRTVGMLRDGPGNQRLLDAVMAQYDIAAGAVQRRLIAGPEIGDAFRDRRIDAMLVLGLVSAGMLPEAVAVATAVGGGPPVFIPIGEAEAIAQRLTVYEAAEVVRGAFGGDPPRPGQAIDTLAVTQRLVARASLRDGIVGDVTRFILTERPALAQLAPLAARIEAPSTEKGQAMPVHPGAAAYLDGEEETFFEKYGDYFYIGAIGASMLASIGAALMGSFRARKPTAADAYVARLLAILAEARIVDDSAALDALEREADQILAHALSGGRAKTLDAASFSALSLAFDQARKAITGRREQIGAATPARFLEPPVPLAGE